MAINYQHLNAAVIGAADKKPGASDVVLFAPKADFLVLQKPTAPFVNPGDSKKITAAHTFLVGKGFVEIQCKAKSVEPSGTGNGEAGGQVSNYILKCIVKGESAIIVEFMESLMNEDFVALRNSPECGVDSYVQYGGACSDANISNVQWRGGNRGAGGFKEVEFNIESADLFFYSGAVTKKP